MRWIYIALIIGVGLVLYLSWEPDPSMKHIRFIPAWIGRWADAKPNWELRTAVPFVFLGILMSILPSRWPFYKHWVNSWLMLVGIVILAETGQLFIPERYFQWEDIGWGALGGAIGLCIGAILLFITRKFIGTKRG